MSGSPTALYRYFAEDGRLLYVGVTGKLLDRASQHRFHKGWQPHIRTATIEHFPTREEALEAEKLAIARESPEFNVQHQVYVRGPRTGSHFIEWMWEMRWPKKVDPFVDWT